MKSKSLHISIILFPLLFKLSSQKVPTTCISLLPILPFKYHIKITYYISLNVFQQTGSKPIIPTSNLEDQGNLFWGYLPLGNCLHHGQRELPSLAACLPYHCPAAPPGDIQLWAEPTHHLLLHASIGGYCCSLPGIFFDLPVQLCTVLHQQGHLLQDVALHHAVWSWLQRCQWLLYRNCNLARFQPDFASSNPGNL